MLGQLLTVTGEMQFPLPKPPWHRLTATKKTHATRRGQHREDQVAANTAQQPRSARHRVHLKHSINVSNADGFWCSFRGRSGGVCVQWKTHVNKRAGGGGRARLVSVYLASPSQNRVTAHHITPQQHKRETSAGTKVANPTRAGGATASNHTRDVIPSSHILGVNRLTSSPANRGAISTYNNSKPK